MKIGLQIPNFTWPGGPAQIPGTLAEIARVADDVGFYSLWVMDHFFQISMVGPYENDMLEGYNTLGYLAALTRRAKLGTMVTGVIYRYPGILVKTATSLDVLSGGRAYFGIGAAWNEREAKGLGVPFPRLACASNCSKKRCRLPSKCGRPITDPITASITTSKKPCAARNRCHAPTRRFWSGAAAKRRRCDWLPSMRMHVICTEARRR